MQLPTIIEGMDFEVYLKDPAPDPSLSSSTIKALLTTAPRKVWLKNPRLNPDAEPENKTIFDLGEAAHRFFTGTGRPVVEINAPDFRTKAAKDARDAAYADNKTPLLKVNAERARVMADAAIEQVRDNPELSEIFAPGKEAELLREPTMLWIEGGVTHRCRPDFYHPRTNTIIHYKTTGTAIWPSTLAKYAANSGWDYTAAHYEAGARALTGYKPRQFFVVQETDAPHLLLVAELDNAFLETAKMRRERAMMIWGRCLSENRWPGMISKTIKIELPEWHERNLVADKDAENDLEREGGDLLDIMRHWQAPKGWQPPAEQGETQDEKDVIE